MGQGVADYSSLYFKMRKLTPPPIRTIDKLQLIVTLHMLVADAAGGESKQLVFSEHLHGKDARCSWYDAIDEDNGIEFGFKWQCKAAVKLPELMSVPNTPDF